MSFPAQVDPVQPVLLPVALHLEVEIPAEREQLLPKRALSLPPQVFVREVVRMARHAEGCELGGDVGLEVIPAHGAGRVIVSSSSS